MAKFIMKDGKFLNKEANATTTTLTGTLAGIRVLEPEEGSKKLQLDFKSEEDGQEVVNTLNLRLYADPAIKILQCLYGIADIIIGKVITIRLEEREGHGSLIHVLADNETLAACGFVTAYASDKMLFTDKAVAMLKRCFDFRKDVLVYVNADKVYPTLADGSMDVQAVCGFIRDIRRSGRSGELTVTKTGFVNPASARGYIKALNDLRHNGGFMFTLDPEAISEIWEAYTAPLDETPAGEGDAAPGTEPAVEEEV